ncbi:hypothetical protein CDL12_23598 [Handroanthus impetiginosus]|uniref:Membrane-associated kinase regulator 4 n=1 Tax=Handroanthus impetiginosus TaxID=429701 RepID=A0A2G9GFU5_9LAMI|nr:hypothetical protein CDL12_23598 [Handroanthus impetiginosus]
MASNPSLHEHDYADGEEDYIDMELTSSSSPQTREFEFQMSITCNEKETTTSPADELFYKGKLLPLLLPPRRRMVENLTTSSAGFEITKEPLFEEENYYPMPLPTCSTAPCTSTHTPSDSCNISPSESCRVSCELNPDDYFFEWSTELNSFINNQHPTKKPWSKKLRLIKHSILGQKLKASRAYFKSLFNKSACSDESSTKANGDESSNKLLNIVKKRAYPTIAAIIDKEVIIEDNNLHRRSFSSAIKRHSPTKCLSSSSSNSSSSSSSFSINSNGFNELKSLRRSSSATEIEGSIEAAIAYCKKSQQTLSS